MSMSVTYILCLCGVLPASSGWSMYPPVTWLVTKCEDACYILQHAYIDNPTTKLIIYAHGRANIIRLLRFLPQGGLMGRGKRRRQGEGGSRELSSGILSTCMHLYSLFCTLTFVTPNSWYFFESKSVLLCAYGLIVLSGTVWSVSLESDAGGIYFHFMFLLHKH